MALSPMQKRAYHVEQGAVEMYTVDANSAVATHPDEWSWEPWSESERDAYRTRRTEEHKKAVDEAKAAGKPIPPPPVFAEKVEPSKRQRIELDDDAKARAEAADLVRAHEEQEKKRIEEEEKLAQAKALLKSAPPQPEQERRPFGRPGPLTPAEQQAADKAKADTDAKARAKAAADDKAAKDAKDNKTSGPAIAQVGRPVDKAT